MPQLYLLATLLFPADLLTNRAVENPITRRFSLLHRVNRKIESSVEAIFLYLGL